MSFANENGALVCYRNGEKLMIEPWGKDSFRVRATKFGKFTGNDWALTEAVPKLDAKIEFFERDHWVGDGTIDKRQYASITNGRLKAEINFVHASILDKITLVFLIKLTKLEEETGSSRVRYR